MTSFGWLLVFLGCLFGGFGASAIAAARPGPEQFGALLVPAVPILTGFALVVIAWIRKRR